MLYGSILHIGTGEFLYVHTQRKTCEYPQFNVLPVKYLTPLNPETYSFQVKNLLGKYVHIRAWGWLLTIVL